LGSEYSLQSGNPHPMTVTALTCVKLFNNFLPTIRSVNHTVKVCKAVIKEYLFAHRPCCQWGYTWMKCIHSTSG